MIHYIAMVIFVLLIMPVKASAQTPPDLTEVSMTEMREMMSTGSLTSLEVVNYYLGRIHMHNQQGADLRAVISLLDIDQARALAVELDKERAAGISRGPLHGIPVLIKDNIDTADGLANTAGSWLLRDNYPRDDAFIIQQLRAAGAIILGKANLSEWANFRSAESSSGWSSMGGQTKNPYDTTRSPCGSSSGSAVAVSANFIAGAVGTETDGSLICPAHINGIVSIKPTVGLLSRDGIIPISHSQDTAGPMTRTVADAALMLTVMAGYDERDEQSFASSIDYTQALKEGSLKGKRLGVVRDLSGYHSGVDELFNARLEQLRAAGAIIVDDLTWPNGRHWDNAEFEVLLHEFKFGLADYLATTDLPYRSLADLISANQTYQSRVMPWFGQELFQMSEQRTEANVEQYLAAKERAATEAGEKSIDALLAEHNLDAIVAPSGGPAWKIDPITGDHFLGSSSGAPAVAGYPHITVPMGLVQHLPVGMSFFASAKQEALLFEIAYGFEQLTQARTVPSLQPFGH